MTVQISHKRNNWSSILDHDIGHLCFGGRNDISEHSDFGMFEQRLCIFHSDLNISRCCICCLSCASWKSRNNEHDFCVCHLWCWWYLFKKYCVWSWPIFYNVPSKYNSTFVLLSLWFQLRILNMTKIHQCRKMNFYSLSPGFIDHILLVSNFRQLEFSPIIPLFFHFCFAIVIF